MPCDPDGIHRAVLNIVEQRARRGRGPAEPEGRGAGAPRAGRELGEGHRAGQRPRHPRGRSSRTSSSRSSARRGAAGPAWACRCSRKILREHGGDILVQSVPDKGSKFIAADPDEVGVRRRSLAARTSTRRFDSCRSRRTAVGMWVTGRLPSDHVNLFSKIVRNRWWGPTSSQVGGMLLTISPTPQNCVRFSPIG